MTRWQIDDHWITVNSRNHALGFAERTRKNLEHMQEAFDAGFDVHVVTHLANSLLGLVVFPWERDLADRVAHLRVDSLAKQGWPQWEMRLGDSETLGELVRHIRNATAHGHIRFSSDSRQLGQVGIEISDFKPDSDEPFWVARIGGPELRDFCIRFVALIEGALG
jgi:hypothetical protein